MIFMQGMMLIRLSVFIVDHLIRVLVVLALMYLCGMLCCNVCTVEIMIAQFINHSRYISISSRRCRIAFWLIRNIRVIYMFFISFLVSDVKIKTSENLTAQLIPYYMLRVAVNFSIQATHIVIFNLSLAFLHHFSVLQKGLQNRYEQCLGDILTIDFLLIQSFVHHIQNRQI